MLFVKDNHRANFVRLCGFFFGNQINWFLFFFGAIMQVTPKQLTELLPTVLKSKLVPFIKGSPALGKSSIVKNIADKFNLKLIDVRLSQLEPTDLIGFPVLTGTKATYKPLDTFPIETDPIPTGYKGWLVFLDEFNSCNLSVQASAYRLVLDREIGQHKLHNNCLIVSAGNLETDNAIVNPMSSALISRFVHFNLELNIDDWIEWAITNDIDKRIISYINFKPTALYTFNPDSTEPYASPRTWEMLSKVLSIAEPNKIICSGLVGDGVANEFIAYTQIYKDLPTLKEIIDNPLIDLPNELGTKWALLLMVAEQVDKTNANTLQTFFERFPIDLQIIAMRTIKANDVNILIEHMYDWFTKVSEKLC